MEYGGMVHALEEIHRLLQRNGTLIDIHPVAEPSPVEIHGDGRIELVGDLSVRSWCTDYREADKALTEMVQRGLFVVEREAVFDSLNYYGTAAEMYTTQIDALNAFARDAESAGEEVPQIEALAARAEELMQAAVSETDLILRERAHISRLRPTGSTGKHGRLAR